MNLIFLPLYALGLTLLPPIVTQGKYFFWAEILLFPLFFKYFVMVARGKASLPPPPARYLVLFLVIAFVSGVFRGNVGWQISIYEIKGLTSDVFSWGGDGVRFIRWTAVFMTPWVVATVFKEAKGASSKRFILFLSWMIFISACLAVFERFGFFNLANLYSYKRDSNWSGRSFGTFASPLEAGLMYAAGFVFLIQDFLSLWRARWPSTLAALVVGYALFLTQSASGSICALAGLVFMIYRKLPQKVRLPVLLAVPVGLGLISIFASKLWMSWKFYNFLSRTVLWKKLLVIIPSYPWFPLTGMGFTILAVDNSILLLFVIGGIPLVLSLLNWFWYLMKRSDLSLMLPFLIAWVLSWLSLDSIGYWGIGRAGWFLLGLASLGLSQVSPPKKL